MQPKHFLTRGHDVLLAQRLWRREQIRIGSRTNIQDGVVLHALETLDNGEVNEKNLVEHNGHGITAFRGQDIVCVIG